MNNRNFIVFFSAAVLILTGCEAARQGNEKEVIGTGAGAVIGGLLGSQVGGGSGRLWATGAGVLIGALAGSEIGRSLDRADRAYAMQASRQAQSAPIGETISWSNPESGHSGSVTPVREGSTQGGDYCREFYQTVTIGGRQEDAYGTACQNPDGTWRIVN